MRFLPLTALGQYLITRHRRMFADIRKRVLSTLPTLEFAPKQSVAKRMVNKVLNHRNEHGKRPRSPSPYFDGGGGDGDGDVVEVREVKRPKIEGSRDLDEGAAKGGPHWVVSDLDSLEVVKLFRVNTSQLKYVLPPS